MKKLQSLTRLKATELTERQMKNIKGGFTCYVVPPDGLSGFWWDCTEATPYDCLKLMSIGQNSGGCFEN